MADIVCPCGQVITRKQSRTPKYCSPQCARANGWTPERRRAYAEQMREWWRAMTPEQFRQWGGGRPRKLTGSPGQRAELKRLIEEAMRAQ